MTKQRSQTQTLQKQDKWLERAWSSAGQERVRSGSYDQHDGGGDDGDDDDDDDDDGNYDDDVVDNDDVVDDDGLCALARKD
eukprot:474885-Amphidinium_carterae.1